MNFVVGISLLELTLLNPRPKDPREEFTLAKSFALATQTVCKFAKHYYQP